MVILFFFIVGPRAAWLLVCPLRTNSPPQCHPCKLPQEGPLWVTHHPPLPPWSSARSGPEILALQIQNYYWYLNAAAFACPIFNYIQLYILYLFLSLFNHNFLFLFIILNLLLIQIFLTPKEIQRLWKKNFFVEFFWSLTKWSYYIT